MKWPPPTTTAASDGMRPAAVAQVQRDDDDRQENGGEHEVPLRRVDGEAKEIEIAVAMIIDRSSTGGLWQEVVTEHLSDLRARIEAMQRVESFVAQSLECKHHECLDECPDYEELIWETLKAALPSTGADVAAIKRLGTQDRVPVQPRVSPGPKG